MTGCRKELAFRERPLCVRLSAGAERSGRECKGASWEPPLFPLLTGALPYLSPSADFLVLVSVPIQQTVSALEAMTSSAWLRVSKT